MVVGAGVHIGFTFETCVPDPLSACLAGGMFIGGYGGFPSPPSFLSLPSATFAFYKVLFQSYCSFLHPSTASLPLRPLCHCFPHRTLWNGLAIPARVKGRYTPGASPWGKALIRCRAVSGLAVSLRCSCLLPLQPVSVCIRVACPWASCHCSCSPVKWMYTLAPWGP